MEVTLQLLAKALDKQGKHAEAVFHRRRLDLIKAGAT
jgi:hypothetical protein